MVLYMSYACCVAGEISLSTRIMITRVQDPSEITTYNIINTYTMPILHVREREGESHVLDQ